MRIAFRAMHRLGFLLSAVVALQGPPSSTAPWRSAYERGEFQSAAEAVHAAWFDALARNSAKPDIDAAETLGRMYAAGHGVALDPLLACSFFTFATLEAQTRADGSRVPDEQRQRMRHQTCNALSEEDRHRVEELVGCPLFGADAHHFTLGGSRSIRVDRLAVALAHEDHAHTAPLGLPCGSRFAAARHAQVAAADKDSRTRDFIEVFSWISGSDARRAQLQWQVFEVLEQKIELHDGADLVLVDAPAWRQTMPQPELTDVAFTRKPDRDISWRFRGGQEGTIPALDYELAPEAAVGPPAQPTTGDGGMEIVVTDAFGSVLSGAEVVLDGVVRRSVRSDERGSAVFEGLPNGRYEISAARPGLQLLRPVVLDLPAAARVPSLTLKPPGRLLFGIGCGGVDGRTLETLSAAVDVVLHVAVTGQHQTHLPRAPGEEPELRNLATLNQSRVLSIFKARGGPIAPTTLVGQHGGRMDQGTSIDVYEVNRLPPLNVGDEYVLFAHRSANGELWVTLGDNGVFLIRNNQVRPLGTWRVATAWKDRSAEQFFTALRSRVK